jgi:hypothetical protein
MAAAGFIVLFGKKGAFALGLVSLLVAFNATAFLLRRLHYPPWYALLILVYPPAMLLSRTIMSDLPSVALCAVTLALLLPQTFSQNPKPNLTNKYNSGFSLRGLRPRFFYLTHRDISTIAIAPMSLCAYVLKKTPLLRVPAAFFLAGTSILFRETNILLLAPFLAVFLWKHKGVRLQLIVALAAGLALRPLLYTWLFGDPFYIKPSEGFGLQHLPGNLALYLPALLVFIPLGLWAVFRYQGPYSLELKWGVGIFLAVYLLYGYSGWEMSGWKGLVLGPRFFIPALPLFCIACADYFSRNSFFQRLPLRGALSALALISIFTFQTAGYLYGHEQEKLVKAFYRHPEKVHFAGPPEYVSKYFSPLYGDLRPADLEQLKDTAALDQLLERDTFVLVHAVTRRETAQRRDQAARQTRRIEELLKPYRVLSVDSLSVQGGGGLRTWKVGRIGY